MVEEFPVGQRQLTFMRGELAGGVTPEEAPGLPSCAPGAVLGPLRSNTEPEAMVSPPRLLHLS